MAMAKGSDQNIQVFVRVRPFNASETRSRSAVDVISDTELSVKELKHNETYKSFSFNKVFGPKSPQIDVYRAVVEPLIGEVLGGYNCTVFAYGQTGTGKTFTMEGERSSNSVLSWADDPLGGIIPRSLSQLFDELRLMQSEFAVTVSFLELYNEDIFDLLSPSDDTTKLKMYDDGTKKGSVIISGLQQVTVHTKADVYSILEKGSQKRQTAATLMNAHSSRSHTVFTVTVLIREQDHDGEELLRTGKLNLVDLAGSENIGRSGAVLKHAREAGNINQSLLTLGRVITALVENTAHIPYRQSKLTRLLQESLGGCTKTSIIATISPALCNLDETLSTVEYAYRAKNIKNKPEINQKVCKKTFLKEYSEEIERLQQDLEATRQCIGIYLDQSEYQGKLERIEQLTAEVKERREHINTLHEEYAKKIALCDEIQEKVNQSLETLTELTTAKVKTEETLANILSSTSATKMTLLEREHLLSRHVNTCERLASQHETLNSTAKEQLQNLDFLATKLELARKTSHQNEKAFQEFSLSNISRADVIGDAVDSSVNRCLQQSSRVQSTIRDGALRSLDKFSSVDDSVRHFNRIPGELEALTCIISKSAKSEVDRLVYYVGIVNDSHDCAANKLAKIKMLVKHYTDDLKNNLQEKIRRASEQVDKIETEKQLFEKRHSSWGLNPEECTKICDEFSHVYSNLCALLDQATCRHKNFTENCSKTQKKISTYLEMANKIMNGLTQAHQEWEGDLEIHKQSSELLSQIKDMFTSSNLAFSSLLNNVVMRTGDLELEHSQKLNDLVEEVSSVMKEEVDLPSRDLLMEDVSQSMQVLEGTFYKLLSTSEDALHNDQVLRSEELSSLLSKTEEQSVQAVKTVNNCLEGISKFENEMINVASSVESQVNDISGDMKSLIGEVSNELTLCQNSMENFLSSGIQSPIATGLTPQRLPLRISREIPATSPHEKILKRFRKDYGNFILSSQKQDSNDTSVSSPLSACDDTESDAPLVCEPVRHVIADKENVQQISEQELDAKKYNNVISLSRKPFQESN